MVKNMHRTPKNDAAPKSIRRSDCKCPSQDEGYRLAKEHCKISIEIKGDVSVRDDSFQNAFHSVPNAEELKGGIPQNAMRCAKHVTVRGPPKKKNDKTSLHFILDCQTVVTGLTAPAPCM